MFHFVRKLIPPLSIRLPIRLYSSNIIDPVAVQMINYALNLARSHKSTDSYTQGLLVLEQCHNMSQENTKGVALLAMSNLLAQRGELNQAIEKLEGIKDLDNSNFGIRVAGIEGLIGLNLEMGKDDAALMLVDKCLEFLTTVPKDSQCGSGEFEVLHTRAKAVKGLVELVLGNVENAKMCFEGTPDDKTCSRNVLLSHGEFLHATGNFALAKEYYQKIMHETTDTESFEDVHTLSACNMVPNEVLLGATCALGQLEAHSGNFGDAEETLTKALTKAEELFGLHHPKVGVILTCIALMFRHKAKLEHSSSILIQEGLYRKAIDMLKAPSLDVEESKVQRSDIAALARGGYAEILCVQENRKTEGERMRQWAEKTWRNRRLSLAEALDISEPCSKVTVIDTRISRAV
ncbi:hypothetical protein ACHQM5_020186 [Ranunculus cassubicifolius]